MLDELEQGASTWAWTTQQELGTDPNGESRTNSGLS